MSDKPQSHGPASIDATLAEALQVFDPDSELDYSVPYIVKRIDNIMGFTSERFEPEAFRTAVEKVIHEMHRMRSLIGRLLKDIQAMPDTELEKFDSLAQKLHQAAEAIADWERASGLARWERLSNAADVSISHGYRLMSAVQRIAKK